MQGNNPVFSRTEGFSGRQAGTDLATPRVDQLEDMYAAPSATPVQTGRMTYDDVVMKTGITFGVLLVGAVVGWQLPQLAFVGLVVGLVLGLVNAFKREPSPLLILAYAAFEGLFVGGISFVFENMQVGTRADGTAITLDGIVAQAVLATLAVFAVSLWAYRSKKIRVTPRFRRGVMIALIGYLVFCVVNLLFQIFGSPDSPFGFRQGLFGILIGLFAVGLAAFCLILDFDFIDQGVRNGLPARFAWTAAFGLTVTLVWLYVEMLRLLAILRGE
ncbi:MAG TPA: Bax inhibitor-1/YccA family protein [Jiangellaceae bacterium]|nr:Bax inhibitor-1/YccA family protein [Jiangellaceae bacterium]